MTCARCEALAREVEELRYELDFATDERIGKVQRGLDLSPSQAKIVLALYAARGRALSKLYLEERIEYNTEAGETNLISVQVSNAKRRAGGKIIANAWGLGFFITPLGTEMVARALGE